MNFISCDLRLSQTSGKLRMQTVVAEPHCSPGKISVALGYDKDVFVKSGERNGCLIVGAKNELRTFL